MNFCPNEENTLYLHPWDSKPEPAVSVESLRKKRGGRGGGRPSPNPSIQQPPHSSPGLKHHHHHYQSEDCGENQLELQSFQPTETSQAKHSLLQVPLLRSEFVYLIWILICALQGKNLPIHMFQQLGNEVEMPVHNCSTFLPQGKLPIVSTGCVYHTR